MPRPKSHTPQNLAAAAMEQFWRFGFEATSMDDLVRATGVSRHGVYGDFGSKHGLYLAAFDAYQRDVVTPAFAQVEAPDAGLEAIKAYFEQQIRRAEEGGLPGPGCLVANAMTEKAPHDPDVLEKTRAHNERLRAGFFDALIRASNRKMKQRKATCAQLSNLLVVFASGLWSVSRTIDNGRHLRLMARSMIAMVEEKISQ